MPDSGTFRRSLHIVQLSLRVIAKNKKLLVFPTVSFVLTLMILAAFFAPTMLDPTSASWRQWDAWQTLIHRSGAAFNSWNVDGHPGRPWIGYLTLVAFYLGSMVSSTFVNVAFYHEIIKGMAGEGVSLRRGVAFACRRIRAILVWSLFAGSIGLLLQSIPERFGLLGKIIPRLVGFTWSIAATFVIPIMIRTESANPLTLLKSSVTTIRNTWGEFVVGYAGIQFFPMVVVLVVPLIWILARDGSVAAGLTVWFLLAMTWGMFIYMVSSVFRCALYVYASEGAVPEPYSADILDAAWKVAKR